MKMSKPLYFPSLDGLRFFAFLLVFVHHLPQSTHPVLAMLNRQGWVGVHVFLFLSAFLLTAILRSEQQANGSISVIKFYIRRGLRIWPLYFLFCLCAFIVTIVLRPQSPVEWFRFSGLILFVDNINSGMIGYNPIMFVPHLWTISLEEQFYLILPILLSAWLAKPKQLLWGLMAFWLLFLIVRTVLVLLQSQHPMIWTSVFSADALLLGTFVGAIHSPPPPGKHG